MVGNVPGTLLDSCVMPATRFFNQFYYRIAVKAFPVMHRYQSATVLTTVLPVLFNDEPVDSSLFDRSQVCLGIDVVVGSVAFLQPFDFLAGILVTFDAELSRAWQYLVIEAAAFGEQVGTAHVPRAAAGAGGGFMVIQARQVTAAQGAVDSAGRD